MRWECSECGAPTTRARRPVRCDECGTAGIIFALSDEQNELEPEAGDLRASWFQAGLDQAAATTSSTVAA
jgi:hypothetical protein